MWVWMAADRDRPVDPRLTLAHRTPLSGAATQLDLFASVAISSDGSA